jgi:hypothetical protein
MSTVSALTLPTDLVERQRAYRQMIGRLRDLVHRWVPQGAVVAVVSKGDPDLLCFDGRRGCHFLHDSSGAYAGYHPRDSAAAIEQLEALRAQGVEFLVVPSTSNWWFQHYADFGDHLRGYETIADEADTGIIVALQEIVAAGDAPPACEWVQDHDLVRHEVLSAQIADLMHHLAPGDEPVSVLQPDGSIPFQIEHRPTLLLTPPRDSPDIRPPGWIHGLEAQLTGHWCEGAAFLIVPRTAFEWWEQHPSFRLQVERRFRRITRQAHVGLIFELDPKGVTEE